MSHGERGAVAAAVLALVGVLVGAALPAQAQVRVGGGILVGGSRAPAPAGAPGVEQVQLTPRRLSARTQHLRGGSWMTVSRDGRVVVVYGRQSITVHVDGKETRTFAANTPYRLAFSPDGNRLLVLPEQRGAALSLFDLRTGAELTRWPILDNRYGVELVFPDERTALFYTGCRLMRIDVANPSVPAEQVGPALCDEQQSYVTARYSEDGRYWMTTNTELYPSRASIRVLDARTGSERAWLTDPEYNIGRPEFDPRGRYACFQDEDAKSLRCVEASGAVRTIAWGRKVDSLAFDSASSRLSFLFEEGGGVQGLYLADLATGGVRRLGETKDQRVSFWGRGLATMNHPEGTGGATFWSLEGLWRATLFPTQEVEWVQPVPGQPDQVFLPFAVGDGERIMRVRLGG
jgi:hypothetical protein